MSENVTASRRIAISGSASVGKTSLTSALANNLGLAWIREEMREYLESSRANLSELPPAQVGSLLMRLWGERKQREANAPGFIADNCSLDFAAYALYYGCLDSENASVLLSETVEHIGSYDAIFVLPWGVLPYNHDGIRPPNQYLQLRYQLIVEGLLQRYTPSKVHYIPESIVDLAERCKWVLSKLEQPEDVRGRTGQATDGRLGNYTQSDSKGKGFVYLVGGGPGDPRLLTLRAFELLQKADIVAHDLLISPSVLAQVPVTAKLVAVGRRHGAARSNYRLHPEVLAHARAGKMVVRLKCGDPLVFGRGGEEAEELAAAGIPFEIVPGISAALGAAAYAGIPLTHREYASEVTFSTGHDAENELKVNESPNPSRRGTVVLFMAARTLKANLDRLIHHGYPEDTPVAYVVGATTPVQRVVVGTLATLPEKIGGMNPETPALVIAGEVVDLRAKISWFDRNWFEGKPLYGSRILIARARPGTSGIAAHLQNLGANVIEAPQVVVKPLEDYSALDHAMNRLDEFDAVMFGCAEGVTPVLHHVRSLAPDTRFRAFAVGERAAAALADAGVSPVLTMQGGCSEALYRHQDLICGKRFLLITSDRGRPGLLKELIELGAAVESIPAYQVTHNFAALSAGSLDIDLVVLPSSSAARLLLTSPAGSLLKATPMVAMGPETEAAARACGVCQVIQSDEDTLESLVSCVIQQRANKAAQLRTCVAPEILVEAGGHE